MGKALLIVDVQNDFCPGGSLPVPDGNEVVPILSELARRFSSSRWPVYASRDWHPSETKHFKPYGGLWPPHCVAGTYGSEFHPDLQLPESTIVMSKGEDPDKDAYSAFQARDDQGVSLKESFLRRGVEIIFVGGLATDYCVKETVLDGLREGFQVFLISDAIRGVEIQPGDSSRAVEEMVMKGARVTCLDEMSSE
jgi:nicotinamidase/pyrazinamidase